MEPQKQQLINGGQDRLVPSRLLILMIGLGRQTTECQIQYVTDMSNNTAFIFSVHEIISMRYAAYQS